ncbi:hypothetical protein [Flavobacterium sp.]|uniref:hypothetical protein n=1 Tax=Flavobacterium sp. TaxID=239 RepID=UPI003F6A2366
MIKPEQLKYCQICIHRKLDFEKGMQCKLTNDFPTFENTCPTFELDEFAKSKNDSKPKYNNSDDSSGPGWRTVLSVILMVIALIRLASTCSKINDNRSSRNNFDSEMNGMIEQIQRQNKYRDQINDLDRETRNDLGILKMQSDSLISISKTKQLLLPSGYYYMKISEAPEIVFTGRDTRNSNIVVYKLKKEGTKKPAAIWKEFRSRIVSDLMESKVSYKSLNNDDFEYALDMSLVVINGYAWVEEEGDYWYICQFENSHENKQTVYNNSMNFWRYQLKDKK